MIFSSPLGIIGLLSLLVLFLIYVLKPKYEERKVSSIFIWELSLKYQKIKIPFQWLKSSVVLILQISILILSTLLLTKPEVILNSKNTEQILIIESSAAMNTKDNGETRFEKALKEVQSIASTASKSKPITIIAAGDSANYVVRRETNPILIEQSLLNIRCEYGTADIDDALDLAGNVRDENNEAKITLFGCKNYDDTGIVNVINLSNNEWNAAILNFESVLMNGYYEFNADLASYNKSKKLAIAFLIDGNVFSSQFIDFNNNEPKSINLTSEKKVLSYEYAELRIEAEDSLKYDNSFFLYGGNENKFNVQLVSDTPRFIRTALTSVGNVQIQEYPASISSEDELNIQYSGYDLYIFDGYVPLELPKDGAVWIFNPVELSTYPGFNEGLITFGNANSLLLSYPLEKTKNDIQSTHAKDIIKNISASSITISKYTSILEYNGFESLLSYEDEPVVLIKEVNDVKVSVFAFDLAYSNIAMTIYFPQLINNLYKYSLTETINKYVYYFRDLVEINAKLGTKSISISSSKNSETYSTFPIIYTIENVGTHTISQYSKNGEVSETQFFVRIPRNESDFTYKGVALHVPIGNTSPQNKTDTYETYDVVYILAALILALVVIEWGVQYREQY